MTDRPRDPDCISWRIPPNETPSDPVPEADSTLAFRAVAPRAPTHILIVPRDHIASADKLTETDGELLGRIFATAAEIARAEGISDAGYRIVTNIGEWGGQSVDHLHFHLMGGRAFSWPPG